MIFKLLTDPQSITHEFLILDLRIVQSVSIYHLWILQSVSINLWIPQSISIYHL